MYNRIKYQPFVLDNLKNCDYDCDGDYIMVEEERPSFLKKKSLRDLQMIAMKGGHQSMSISNLCKSQIIDLLSNRKIYPKRVSLVLRRTVWNTYIGTEIGRYPCLLCGIVGITQLEFKCGFNTPGSTLIENLLPICDVCHNNKKDRTFSEYLRLINKARLHTLPEKTREIFKTGCLVQPCPEGCFERDVVRAIATSSILWEQFLHLSSMRGFKKIKIHMFHKQIVLSL